MRTIILLITFLFSFNQKTNAQFLEVGDKWIFDTRDYSIGNGFYSEKFDSIVINQDTLINGIQYYELIASEESPCGIFTSTEYLREEGDKIFRLSKDFSYENLIIDFSFQADYNVNYETSWFNGEIQTTVINDSLGIEILPNGEPIDIIYQRIINNSSYDDNTQYKLSKEVGYIQFGLLFPDIGTGLCDVMKSINLRCKISENDTIKLTDLDCYETSIVLSTDQFESDQSCLISPNPTNGIITVDDNFKIISITDITGRTIYYNQFNGKIDLSNCKSGIYVIRVQDIFNTKSIKSIKIVKM